MMIMTNDSMISFNAITCLNPLYSYRAVKVMKIANDPDIGQVIGLRKLHEITIILELTLTLSGY